MRAVGQYRCVWAPVVGLWLAGSTWGCESEPVADPEDSAVAAHVQQLRAGEGMAGEAFVGLDILPTDKAGRALACDEGALDVEVAYSAGSDGAFTALTEQAVTLGCGQAAGDFALVVDNSGSQDGFLPQLKHAARDIVHEVLDLNGRASLVRVSTDASVLQPLTEDRPALEHALNGMHVANGWTALYDGVRMANETLGSASQGASRLRFADAATFCQASAKLGIVAITDGRENNSSNQRLRNDSYPGDGIDTSAEDLLNLRVDGISTPIYTVGMGEEVDHAQLAAIAGHSGGRHMRIEGPSDIPHAFDVLADYASSRHQVCATLPTGVCGPVSMRVRYRYQTGKNKKAALEEGERHYQLQLPCPVEDAAQPASGRVATLLMAISEMELPAADRQRLVAQAVDAVSPVAAPQVMVVLDDNHHGEHPQDTAIVVDLLRAAGHSVTFMHEPADGFTLEQIAGADVVWFANPGYPPDDARSIDSLLAFVRAGGGAVLQGDDMSMSFGHAFSMSELTGLVHGDNGVSYCGRTVNNGQGRYVVTLGADAQEPLLSGLSGRAFDYTDDIDTSHTTVAGATVLATAVVPNASGCSPKPAIVIFTPAPPQRP